MQSLHRMTTSKIIADSTIHRLSHHHRWILHVQLMRECPCCTARISSVMEVSSLDPFVLGQSDFSCVDANDVIAAVV